MIEDKINELEKLKKINKQRKIFLTILLIILILASISFGRIIAELIAESNNASELMEEIWRQEIEQLNSRFTPYIGNNRLGTKTRELCDKIRMTNWGIDDERWTVYIKFGDITGLDTREKWKNSDATCDEDEILSIMRAKINGRQRYDITASYDENGRIMGIGIIERPSESDNT